MVIIPSKDQSTVQHAPKSSPRARFIKATGLDRLERENREGVDALFSTLEAMIAPKHEEISIRQNLKPGEEDKSPYTFHSIKPQVIERALSEVYADAAPEVRAWFDHWQSQCAAREDRYWYLKWFLYKRFRHTDWRNRRREHASNQAFDSRRVSAPNGPFPRPPQTVRGTNYDPVRDRVMIGGIINEMAWAED